MSIDALGNLAGLLVAEDLLELVAVHALFLDDGQAVDHGRLHGDTRRGGSGAPVVDHD